MKSPSSTLIDGLTEKLRSAKEALQAAGDTLAKAEAREAEARSAMTAAEAKERLASLAQARAETQAAADRRALETAEAALTAERQRNNVLAQQLAEINKRLNTPIPPVTYEATMQRKDEAGRLSGFVLKPVEGGR